MNDISTLSRDSNGLTLQAFSPNPKETKQIQVIGTNSPNICSLNIMQMTANKIHNL